MNLDLSSNNKILLYKRRWYILSIYCLNCFLISASLVIFTVTPVSTHNYYKEADVDMADLNLGLSIAEIFAILSLLITVIIDLKFDNLRILMVVGAWIELLSSVIRMFPTWISSVRPYALYFINASVVVNQVGGSFYYSTPSDISATWFSSKERGVTTAINAQSLSLGYAVAFISLPFIVQKPASYPKMLYGFLIIQCICTLLVTLYFPARPPTPPSFSEKEKNNKTQKKDGFEMENEIEREENEITSHLLTNTSDISPPPSSTSQSQQSFLDKLKILILLFKKPSMYFICLSVATKIASIYAWGANVNFFYTSLGWSESQGGIFAFLSSIFPIFASIILSFIAEKWFKTKTKMIVMITIILLGLTFVFYLFALPLPSLSSPLFKPPYWLFSLFVIFAGIFGGCSTGLLLEISTDITYPYSETIVVSFLNVLMNMTDSLVLFIYSLLGLGWMTIISFVLCVISFVTLFVVEHEQKRMLLEVKQMDP